MSITKSNTTNYLKSSPKRLGSPVSKEVGNSSSVDIFSRGSVVGGCDNPIQIRIDTLISSKCDLPYDWYKELGLDKGNASRIRRGLIIPSKEWRIKIAQYFGVDSTTIWPVDYKSWFELSSAVDEFESKVERLKHG